MAPVDYQNIQHQLRARRHELIAEISSGSELDETLLARLADVQSAIAAVEAEGRTAGGWSLDRRHSAGRSSVGPGCGTTNKTRRGFLLVNRTCAQQHPWARNASC